MTSPHHPAPSGTLQLAVADARLAVHTAGSGIPLVLLHAFPLDHSMWVLQEPLAEQVRLIVPDLRGFGASDEALPESIAAWADDALWRDGGWHFPAVGPHTIHHERGGRFFRTGEPLTAARPPRQTMAPNDSSAKLK